MEQDKNMASGRLSSSIMAVEIENSSAQKPQIITIKCQYFYHNAACSMFICESNAFSIRNMECTISTSSTVKWLPPLVLAVHITIDVLYCTVSQKLNGEEIKPELEATAPNIIFFPRERKKKQKKHMHSTNTE